jgi:hypothetical protein
MTGNQGGRAVRKVPEPCGSGLQLVVARMNSEMTRSQSEAARRVCGRPRCRSAREPGNANRRIVYALRRGRRVRSRTWANTLDSCIPFSWATKGINSAIN